MRPGGSHQGGEQTVGPEHKRMTAASKESAGRKWLSGILPAPTRSERGEGRCPAGRNGHEHRGSSRGRGPGTMERIRRDNVGKVRLAAGADSNLQRSPYRGRPEAGGGSWTGAWARRSDEDRVTPVEVVRDITPGRVTPEPGKGALGTWRSVNGGAIRTPSRGNRVSSRTGERGGKPAMSGAYAGQRLSFALAAEGRRGRCHGQNRTRENRPSGIAGRPRETWLMVEL